jgi:proline dehydrogenase
MLRSGFLWLSEHQGIFDFVKRNGVARKMASRFVAGEDVDSALDVARALNARGIGASLDLLGESVSDRSESERARDAVIQILDRIAGEVTGDTNVSIKLTQMGLDLSDEVCAANLRAVLDRARQHGIFVRVDMEGSPYTERTLDLFHREFHPEYKDLVGVVIQSYMRRSAADVARLVETRARVRLCKGAYAEPASIAFQEREEVSASYTQLAAQLLEHGNYPAIATHDEEMIDHTIKFVTANGIPADRFEFQMLYGVRRDLQDRLKKSGYNMRVYVPFGTQWYPYLMRRLAERPSNVMFMAASIVKESLSDK